MTRFPASLACSIAFAILAQTAAAAAAAATAADLPVLLEKSGPIREQLFTLPDTPADATFSVTFSTRGLSAANSQLTVTLQRNKMVQLRKTLHAGDPDWTTLWKSSPGRAAIHISNATNVPAPATFDLRVTRWNGGASASLEREPNNRPEDANLIELDSLTFASADENEYVPSGNDRLTKETDLRGDVDWYKFNFNAATPKLVFFQLELTDRDFLPVDVSIHRIENGKLSVFFDGEDPVALPHEGQAIPGAKFITRVLRDHGDYYVAVRANHPEYRLRTRVYDAPPYANPEQAVQVAADYILGAGDAWHANLPRRGGVLDRVANVHQETSLCVSCHATHFPQRAQMYALKNGYAVHQRQQLQFLTERFYNNPRPFYGFEKDGAVWARMISAAANVLSRMSVLLGMYEQQVSNEPRPWFHRGVSEYLKIYYDGRTRLPADETNGNTPLVSAHEVAWYAWINSKDERLPEFVASGEVKNFVDLCYQTLALAEMDRAKYAPRIAANAERILAAQRESGQWAMRFGDKEPEVEFQTGHALWALSAAGVPRDHPKVSKGLKYLLARQQPFGGWMDPKQSYENFRTPFRETQMAVLALSSYFPKPGRNAGWDAVKTGALAPDPATRLVQLDGLWGPQSASLMKDIEASASSKDAYLRQSAVETLGRIAQPESMPVIAARLGDPSKLVRRTAAWAMRQIYSRHSDVSTAPLEQALRSPDERVRWGATRVFALHHATLARQPKMIDALISATRDANTAVRMQAFKGLWQSWFWNADTATKEKIEDTFLAAIAEPQHPWIDRNLREGIYNIADENIRYYYNNWVALLPREEDRRRSIEGRLAVERRLADKFAKVLESGPDLQKRVLLTALADFHLRVAEPYNIEAKPSPDFPPPYNRIGNDVEQIAFFGSSADRFSKALLPLLESNDEQLRRLAQRAALLTREVRFPGVNEVAGPAGEPAKQVAAHVAKATPPRPQSTRAASAGRPTRRLDDTFFRGYVQPILERRGKDGYACVHCHASHTLFDGTLQTARNVVDTQNPENSLILRKPTSTAESEGVVGAKELAHGGGVRFDKNSAEYLTILDWIKGAVE